MPYIPKDQIAAAREMDLLTYLRRFEPEELVHIGGDTYATRTHDSLKISNGKWCWWSRNIGGTNALDYLTRVEGLSFLDAVQRILGELPRVPTKSEPTAPLPKTEFTLPPKHADNRRVFAYLRSRGIDALSYLTLLKLRGQDWHTANTLSLSGIYQPRKDGSIRFPAALEQYLKDNPGVARIVLCLDNDGPGRAASAAIQKRLSEYEIIDNPPCRGKDYNDQLQLVKGISGRVRTRGGEAR